METASIGSFITGTVLIALAAIEQIRGRSQINDLLSAGSICYGASIVAYVVSRYFVGWSW